LGLVLFSLYTSSIASLTFEHGVCQQQYADDTQLFVPISPANLDCNLSKLKTCLSSLQTWFLHNGLSLNPDKTEAICFGTPGRRKSLSHLTSISILDSTVALSDSIKLLGVTLDAGLNFDHHTSNVCSSSYYHIRSLRRIRPYLDLAAAKSVASSIIGSRLDYANSVLHGIPVRNLKRLQRVQNSLARVTLPQPDPAVRSHTLLSSLHWLPIRQRISFKVGTFVFHSLHGTAPYYLSSLLHHYEPPRHLRSSDRHLLSVPRTCTSIGSRGFRYSAPSFWNKLPDSLRSTDTYSSFKSHLKTCLFREI